MLMRRIGNFLQTLLLLALMTALLSLIGLIVAGGSGLVWGVILGLVFLSLTGRVMPRLILRLYNARALAFREAPELYVLLQGLAQRAGLPSLPALYYIPSSVMNAFTVGNRQSAAIALTDGILRHLNRRELAGVMAHEVSHIQSNDLRIMSLADILSRLTHILSAVGQFLLLLFIPLMFIAGMGVSWVTLAALLFFIFAPLLSVTLQMALSRTREYEADLGAVRLTGDAEGLASALGKIEQYPRSFWDTLLTPGRKVPDPSLLRTHPHTQKRVDRLRKLAADNPRPLDLFSREEPVSREYDSVSRKPRWNLWGLWH